MGKRADELGAQEHRCVETTAAPHCKSGSILGPFAAEGIKRKCAFLRNAKEIQAPFPQAAELRAGGLLYRAILSAIMIFARLSR